MINWNEIYMERINKLFKQLDEYIQQINNVYSEYKLWTGDFFTTYKNDKGETINEIILNYLYKNIDIK